MKNKKGRVWLLLALAGTAALFWLRPNPESAPLPTAGSAQPSQQGADVRRLAKDRGPGNSSPDPTDHSRSSDLAPGPVTVPFSLHKVQSQPPALFMIEGCTLSSQGGPLAGARVALAGERDLEGGLFESPAEAAISRADGAFEIRLDAPFSGWLEVTKPGFARILESVELSEPGVLRRDFRLRAATGTISGRVIDGILGTPLAGALVQATVRDNVEPGLEMTPKAVRSAEGGEFAFAEVPEGWVSLVALADEYFEDQKELRISEGGSPRVELRLVRGDVFRLQVRDPRGAPIPGASVRRPDHWVVKTDPFGRVALPLIPELTTVQFKVWADGFRSAEFEFEHGRLPESVTLEDGLEFFGRVLSENGAPVQGALVTINGAAGAAVRTDAHGRFSRLVPNPPVHAIHVRKAGYLTQGFDFEDPGPVCPVTLRLKASEAGLIGRALHSDGSPAWRFIVNLISVAGGESYSQVFENPQGNFAVYDAPAGRYHVEVVAAGSPLRISTASAQVTLEKNRTVIRDFQLVDRVLPLRLNGSISTIP